MKNLKYLDIYRWIKFQIDQKIWRPCTKIPAERILSEELSVNRLTLRKALQILVNEGLIEKRIGAGTFVTNYSKR